MRKKISCKIIRSIPLNGSILSKLSFAADFKDCMQNTHTSFSKAFIYTKQMEKKQMLYDDIAIAGIIDSYA